MKINDVIELMYSARRSGIDILVNDGNLQVKVPARSVVSEELLENIRTNKRQILDLLQNDKWRPTPSGAGDRIAVDEGKARLQRLPLSFSQERLWVVDQLEGGSVQYHHSIVLRIRGALDAGAVQFALQSVVNRHEILRTVIGQDEGQPYQRVLPEDNWQLAVTGRTGSRHDAEAMRDYVGELINTPFDLAKDHPMRGHLLKLADGEWLLVIVLHHIASDGWSTRILTREFIDYYTSYAEGRPSGQTPLPIQYSDYAIWQRNHISNDTLAGKLAYWKEQLSDIEPLDLPLKPGHAAKPGIDGERVSLTIDRDSTEQVIAFTRREGITLYMFLLGVFKLLLYRYTGQDDIAVGTSLAGRQQHEVEGLIGFFSNTIVLRSRVDGAITVRELLHTIKRTALDGYDNQEVPFDRVVEALNVKREAGQNPLFQVMFVLENVPDTGGTTRSLAGISFLPEDLGVIKAKFDLTLSVVQTSRGLMLALTYKKDLFDAGMMEQLLRHYECLLRLSLSSPDSQVGALPMAGEEEYAPAMAGWDGGAMGYPVENTVGELFEEQALRTPGSPALVFMGETLSYEELDSRSTRLAHFLRERGAGNGQPVPICVERSAKMIVGFLGIIKAGGAYVPIDPEYPAERIGYILDDVASRIVVTDTASRPKLPVDPTLTVVDLDRDWEEICGGPVERVAAGVKPHHPAYVIYTSGSTGMPKGVVIAHRNIVDYVWGIRNRLETTGGLSFAWMSTIGADLGNTAIFWSLLSGGNLHIFPGWLIRDAAGMHDYFRRHRIDCLKIVPSHWLALTIDGTWLLPKKLLIFGGEALPPQLVNAVSGSGLSCRIVNHYGPTETTIGKLLHVVDEDDAFRRTIPLGRPFSNTDIYVLTLQGAICPPGARGEICVGGDGVGLGYLNQPALTAEKFVNYASPMGTCRRIYRTGDLGRMLPDGGIEFLGRKDDQVKIRGYRVELGEVESVLRGHPQVRHCAVVAREDGAGAKQLAAFIVPEELYVRAEVLTWLGTRLPENMRPSLVVELESLPLTGNGKIDRKALAAMEPETQAAQEYVAPRTAMELSIADVWQELLGVERVGITDNFFNLGGHSLLAIRVITAIRRQLEIEISIGDIFDHPTIGALAEQLTGRSLAEQLAGRSGKSGVPPLIRQPRPAFIPLSFSQERLWFIHRLEGTRQYHIPWVLRLQGDVEETLLGEALRGVIVRHEVLRTMIREEGGQPHQLIADAADWKLEVLDVPGPAHGTYEPREHIREWIDRPFDLAADYKLRARLLRQGGGEYLLVMVLHHIASDGWSHAILVNEFMELYSALVEGREPRLGPLPVQYADYALWQRQYLRGELLEKKLAWWKEALGGSLPLELPADRPRPVAPSRRGAVEMFRIDKVLTLQLQALAQREGATVFMTLLAVFQVLLYRYSAQGDICVGTPVANRMQHEVEGLIGFFVNMLVLRIRLDDNPSFTDLLARVRLVTLGAFEHQDVPFEKVVEAVVKERDMSRSPLFQVLFVHQNAASAVDITHKGLPGVKISLGPLNSVMLKFDMTFTISEGAEGMFGTIEYSTDLYDPYRIERMAVHYIELLRAVVAVPGTATGRLNMLGGPEKQQLLAGSCGMMEPLRTATVIDVFEEQAERSPEGVAVIGSAGILSYKELDRRANVLGHYLRRRGVAAETLVGVCIGQSVEMLVSILGIFKAGGAYVPIDPGYPPERIAFLLADTGVSLVLSDKDCGSVIPVRPGVEVVAVDEPLPGDAAEPLPAETTEPLPVEATAVRPPRDVAGHHLAYVIYTSGSTGRPKGVMIEHHSLMNYLLNGECGYIPEYPETAGAGSYVHLKFTFDASLTALFLPLIRGRAIVISEAMGTEIFTDPLFYQHAPYDFIKLTPAHLTLLESAAGGGDPVLASRRWIVGGEALQAGQLQPWVDKGVAAEIINEYGPTEATVGCSVYRVDTTAVIPQGAGGLPIGRPIDNVWIYVLDQHGGLAPAGVPGEICIGGEGLARGYLNRPELTAEKFVADRYSGRPGARIYRTGDIGRWMADGNLEYLGRTDEQVKIRGCRVELGEIEAVLEQSGLFRQPVVLAAPARLAPGGVSRLVAYGIPGEGYDHTELLSFLKARLPEYMLPAQWVVLDKMPLTPHGKVDRMALALLGKEDPAAAGYVAPRTEIEQVLAGLWQELLGIQRVGIRDNFFRIGGHSLLALRLIASLQADYKIVINDLFRHPTIEELAACITYEKNYLQNKLNTLVTRLRENETQGRAEQDKAEAGLAEHSASEMAAYLAAIGESDELDLEDRIPYRKLLLLGSTGFLGMHLLYELLHRYDPDIVLLVRERTDELAYARLREKYTFYFGESLDRFAGRLEVRCGDIAKDKFGLEPDRYHALLSETDCLLNTAANVKHYGNPDDFLSVNTRSMQTMLDFCRAGKIKPLHHVSTLSICGTRLDDDGYLFTEDALEKGKTKTNFYVQSKLAAEKALQAARDEGAIVNIYRVGNLSFHSQTGKFQENIEDNAFYTQLKGFLTFGAAPDGFGELRMSNIDQVAAAILQLFDRRQLLNRNFHVQHPAGMTIGDFAAHARDAGFPVEVVGLADFAGRALQCYPANKELVNRLLLHFDLFGEERPQHEKTYRVCSERTDHFLRRLQFTWKPIQREGIHLMLQHGIEVNYFTK